MKTRPRREKRVADSICPTEVPVSNVTPCDWHAEDKAFRYIDLTSQVHAFAEIE